MTTCMNNYNSVYMCMQSIIFFPDTGRRVRQFSTDVSYACTFKLHNA